MFAHQVINQVDRFLHHMVQINHEFRKTLTKLSELVRVAHKYHIGNYINVLNNVVYPVLHKHYNETGERVTAFETPSLIPHTQAPYPITWIDGFVDEGSINKRGLLIHKQDNTLYVYSTFCNVNMWCVNPFIGILTFDKEGLLVNSEVKTSSLYNLDARHEQAVADIKAMTIGVYYLFLAINARNIKMVESTPSKLLARITNKNKCPQLVYKTLMITNDVVRYEKKNNSSYVVKDILPRHDVAGHPRHYKRSGKTINIKAHERGNLKNGRIIKEYVFVNGVSRKRTKKVMKGGDI